MLTCHSGGQNWSVSQSRVDSGNCSTYSFPVIAFNLAVWHFILCMCILPSTEQSLNETSCRALELLCIAPTSLVLCLTNWSCRNLPKIWSQWLLYRDSHSFLGLLLLYGVWKVTSGRVLRLLYDSFVSIHSENTLKYCMFSNVRKQLLQIFCPVFYMFTGRGTTLIHVISLWTEKQS